jgi:hypothetical protein
LADIEFEMNFSQRRNDATENTGVAPLREILN